MPTMGEDSWSPISTPAAQRRNTLHAVRKRDAFQQLAKRTTIEISVEPHKEKTLVVPFNHSLNERNQPGEKLGFVKNNHCESHEVFVAHVVQRLNALARHTVLVVCDNIVFDTIPTVVFVLQDKNSLSDTGMA
jgi:hypothetical protein